MLIVGAGCAGLACATTLAEGGVQPLVVDKARGVGGRAATRRVDGQPVDHGVLFYHGSDPAFLEALDRVEATQIAWPRIVTGEGSPCLPRAFHDHERRVAFREGLTAFPKYLARGLEVRLKTRVSALSLDDAAFRVDLEEEGSLAVATLVLALPAEQASALLETLPGSEQLDSLRALLAMAMTEPCVSVIAGYPLEVSAPTWDVHYPGGGSVLALAAHDSGKRAEKHAHVIVYQCAPGFSRKVLDDEDTGIATQVLEAAATHLGEWSVNPSFTQVHRWRFARARACAFGSPLLVRLPGGQRLGITGEFFEPRGGVEAAFLAGRALARRILGERD